MWQYFWPHISLIYRNLTGGKTHVCHPVIFLSPRRGRDRMVVGIKTTYAISSYHH
jgi:hypothetical protein